MVHGPVSLAAVEPIEAAVELGDVRRCQVGVVGELGAGVGTVGRADSQEVDRVAVVAAERRAQGVRRRVAGRAGVRVGEGGRVDHGDLVDGDPAGRGAVDVAGRGLRSSPAADENGHRAVEDPLPGASLHQHARTLTVSSRLSRWKARRVDHAARPLPLAPAARSSASALGPYRSASSPDGVGVPGSARRLAAEGSHRPTRLDPSDDRRRSASAADAERRSSGADARRLTRPLEVEPRRRAGAPGTAERARRRAPAAPRPRVACRVGPLTPPMRVSAAARARSDHAERRRRPQSHAGHRPARVVLEPVGCDDAVRRSGPGRRPDGRT